MFTNPNNRLRENYFMDLALMQAKKIIGNSGKNPAVGCVIIKKNELISSGFTGVNGRPHAEHNAIKNSNNNIKNCELYVTLEPCSNYGKTSPCTKKIIKKKIKKVFFSLKDPDIRSHSKSIIKFRKKKIFVKYGIKLNKIKKFYKSYIYSKNQHLPFVTLKFAVSKDFYSNNVSSKWITNKYSRGRVHLMRSMHDCIITSAKTVKKDNPMLNCRIKGLEKTSPTRIIIDKSLKLPVSSEIVKTAKRNKTIVFYNKINKKKIKALSKNNIKLIWHPLNNKKEFSLKKILFKIKNLGFSRIFIEAGLNLSVKFIQQKLVNNLELYISSHNLGVNGKNNFKKYFNKFVKNYDKQVHDINLFGDKLFTYRLT